MAGGIEQYLYQVISSMKKEGGILKSGKQIAIRDRQGDKMAVRIRQSEDTNCTNQDKPLRRLLSTPFLQKQEDQDDYSIGAKTARVLKNRPRMMCMTPARSLPPINHGGTKRGKIGKVPGSVLKKSIKFSDDNPSLVLRGPRMNSRQTSMLKVKGGGCVEGNCCIIY